MAMKPEVKKVFLDALRSGEYEQGTGRLALVKDDGVVSYCCLGVLSAEGAKAGVCNPLELSDYFTDDQAEKEWVIKASDNEDGVEYVYAYPPQSIYDWAGLTSEDGTALANINDKNDSFAEVIEYIDANL